MFQKGEVYRRRAIHERFGGQQQGGISTPAEHPFIFIFTGESGEQHGYSDGWSADGLYNYTGEGQRGDMQFVRGNAAIRDHAALGRDIHLFSQAGKAMVRYLGQFVYTGHHLVTTNDTEGSNRQAIVFELTPIEQLDSDTAAAQSIEAETPIAALRERALNVTGAAATPKERKVLQRIRSEAIKLYALKRAQGICEGCKANSPFLTKAGEPFLEVHHILRLSDGGPDHPENIVAICPNCHRRAHHSRDASIFNAQLKVIAEAKERS